MKKSLIIGIVILALVILLGIYFYPSLIKVEEEEKLVACAKEGETFSLAYKGEHCCEGLTEWYSGLDTSISIADVCYETGLLAGAPVGTCINCGNGICEDIENPCNCPEDCKGKNKSNFLSIEEFCQSTSWNQTFSKACQKGYIDLPICKFCLK